MPYLIHEHAPINNCQNQEFNDSEEFLDDNALFNEYKASCKFSRLHFEWMDGCVLGVRWIEFTCIASKSLCTIFAFVYGQYGNSVILWWKSLRAMLKTHTHWKGFCLTLFLFPSVFFYIPFSLFAIWIEFVCDARKMKIKRGTHTLRMITGQPWFAHLHVVHPFGSYFKWKWLRSTFTAYSNNPIYYSLNHNINNMLLHTFIENDLSVKWMDTVYSLRTPANPQQTPKVSQQT